MVILGKLFRDNQNIMGYVRRADEAHSPFHKV